MQRLILYFTFSLFVFLSFSVTIFAAEQATCDACGYCPNTNDGGTNQKPSDWNRCVACLYDATKSVEDANATPNGKDSQFDTLTLSGNTAMSTKEGFHYGSTTGCIYLDNNQTKAAGVISQKMFDIIFNFVKVLSISAFLWGSYIIITSSGNPIRLQIGKKLLTTSVISLLISVFSVSILDFIIKTFFGGIF